MVSVTCSSIYKRIIAVVYLGLLFIAVPTLHGQTPTPTPNSTPLTIADATCSVGPGQANLYPSTITVSGMVGTVTDVNVSLKGMTHSYAGDFEILLVGPGGGSQNLVLLSDCGSAAVSNVTLTLDDQAAAQVPQNGSWNAAPNSSITAKPTDYLEQVISSNPADTYPSAPTAVHPAPTGSATLASVFNGINPNGTWRLYVLDDGCGDTGTIAGGWSLTITTAAAAAATTTTVTSSLNPSWTGQSVTFTATVMSGGSNVTTGTVTFTEGATTLAANVAVNGSGQASFGTSSLAQGNHIITATYNGTASFATSNGSVNQRVDNATVVTGNLFCNTGAISIPTSGAATPYASRIFVSGLGSSLAKVKVTLKNVTHAFAEDIDVLLVGPAGQSLVVASDAGTGATTNVTVNFDDAAASLLPSSGAWGAANSTVTVKPVDYDPLAEVDTFPAPAPQPTGTTTLASAFNGTNPNGTWSLYVVDDAFGDGGSIAGGWCLTITAAAKILSIDKPTTTTVRIVFTGTAATEYRVEYASTLVSPTWQSAPGTLAETSAGVYSFTNTPGTTFKFYRVAFP